MVKKTSRFIIVFIFSVLIFKNAYADMVVFKDLEIEDYVKKVATPILINAGLNPKIIDIYLLDDSSINAFVTEKADIFVFSGLLTSIKTDDELAGVLAHETSHVIENHILKQELLQKRQQMLVLASLLAGVAAAAIAHQAAADILSVLTIVPSISAYNNSLQFSREEEMQADQKGVALLDKTKYSAYGLVTLMETLEKQDGTPEYLNSWFSNHPLTSTRITFLKSNILRYKSNLTKKQSTSEELKRVQIKLDAYNLSYNNFIGKYQNQMFDYKVQYGLAIAEYKRSHYRDALLIMQKLVKAHPKDPYFLDLIGDISFDFNKFNDALNYYLELSSYSKDYSVDYKIARSSYSLNTPESLDTSLKYLDLALSKNKNLPSVWYLKYMVLSLQGDIVSAKLALAHQYAVLGDKKMANSLVNQIMPSLPKGSSQWLEAQDLLLN